MSEYLVARLRARLKRGEPIASVTAYDYFSARLAAEADMDFVLVGDSLGNVIQGAPTTLGVSLDDVVYHTRIVSRHFPAERVVLDMPFGSFGISAEETVRNAISAFKAGACGAVKFEGASASNLIAVRMLAEAGVPVIGHIGLQPQRVHSEGGFKKQGKTEEQAERLLREALALEQAGAVAIVLELVQPDVAQRISERLVIPTIGIGSGAGCDGQILVMHDLLGLLPGEAPGFVKQYAQLWDTALSALRSYGAEVRSRSFPEADSAAPTPKPQAVRTLPPAIEEPDSHARAMLEELSSPYGKAGR